jgi:sigma-B regulation protein RsbU (phosphoserine phosphatase)
VLSPAQAGDGIVFALGDVSGKGIAASLLMSHIHAIFRSLSFTGLPLPDLLREANRVMCESTLPTQFATLVCGRLFETGEIEICNAGHCEPLVISKREARPFTVTHLPLGLFADVAYSTHKFTLAPGEALLLYSDGVTEAWNSDEAEYGVDRLSRVALSSTDASPRSLINRCLQDITEFIGRSSKRDDLTLMVVERSGSM